jgi:pimeloyl-ACP methyl ester carboxylesterase
MHDPHHEPDYWRELVRQARESIENEPGFTKDGPRRIALPTLLIVGEADDFGILDQTLTMRRAIPHSALLVLNQIPGENRLVHSSRADVVGPVIIDFLARHRGSKATL